MLLLPHMVVTEFDYMILGVKLKKFGLVVYLAGCTYILSYLLLMNDWQLFYDSFSLICTFLPALLSILIYGQSNLTQKISRLLKVVWVRATLTTVYGLVLVLGQYPFEITVFLAGLGVAILPLFYALCSSLFLGPFSDISANDKVCQ